MYQSWFQSLFTKCVTFHLDLTGKRLWLTSLVPYIFTMIQNSKWILLCSHKLTEFLASYMPIKYDNNYYHIHDNIFCALNS